MLRRLEWTTILALGLGAACGTKEGPQNLGYRLAPPASTEDLEAYYRSLLEQPSCLRHVESGLFICELFSFVPCLHSSSIATPVDTADVPTACVSGTEDTLGKRVDQWCLVGPHVEDGPTEPLESREALARWCGGHSWLEGGFASLACAPPISTSRDASEPTDTSTVTSVADACALFPLEVSLQACRAAFCL